MEIGDWVVSVVEEDGILSVCVARQDGKRVVDAEDVSFGNEMAFRFTVDA